MAVSVTFGSTATAATDGTSALIPTMTIGSETPGRVVAACIVAQSDNVISSVTIGGINATLRVTATDTGSSPDIQAHIYTAPVPTGTTASVEIFVGGTSTFSAASFYVTGLIDDVSDNDSATGSAATISISALTIPTGGAGLATFGNNTDITAVTWTGASESHDTDAGIVRHSSAIITTAGTNTITADGATANQALVGLAWRQSPDAPKISSGSVLRAHTVSVLASASAIWSKPPMLAHHILR